MIGKIYFILRQRRSSRLIFFLAADIVSISAAVWLSFLVRFDGQIPAFYYPLISKVIILAAVFLIPLFYFQRLYSFSWSYVSTNELVALFKAATLGFLFLTITLYLSRGFQFFYGFPRATLAVSYFFAFAAASVFQKEFFLMSSKRALKKKKNEY
jgi:FlaA1/EpsC-like NDP-sugar epimerase